MFLIVFIVYLYSSCKLNENKTSDLRPGFCITGQNCYTLRGADQDLRIFGLQGFNQSRHASKGRDAGSDHVLFCHVAKCGSRAGHCPRTASIQLLHQDLMALCLVHLSETHERIRFSYLFRFLPFQNVAAFSRGRTVRSALTCSAGLFGTHRELVWWFCVRVNRAWVAASVNSRLSLLRSCTMVLIQPETHKRYTRFHWVTMSAGPVAAQRRHTYPGLWSGLGWVGGSSWQPQPDRQMFSLWRSSQIKALLEPFPLPAHGELCGFWLHMQQHG